MRTTLLYTSFLLCLYLILTQCSTTHNTSEYDTYSIEKNIYKPEQAHAFMRNILEANDSERDYFKIQFLNTIMQPAHRWDITQIITHMQTQKSDQLANAVALMSSQLDIMNHQYKKAAQQLSQLNYQQLTQTQQIKWKQLAAHIALNTNQLNPFLTLQQQLMAWNAADDDIASRLNHQSKQQLLYALKHAQTTYQAAWLKFALLAKNTKQSPQSMDHALIDWTNQYPDHEGNQLILAPHPIQNRLASSKHIVFLLPQHGHLKHISKAILQGFLMRKHQIDAPYKVSILDTENETDIATLYQKAIDLHANLIIGPLQKTNCQKLADQHLIQIPTLFLNQVDPNNHNPYLYQFSLSPSDEATEVANAARKYGYARALVIGEETEWSHKIMNQFNLAWQNLDGQILDTMVIDHKQKYLATPVKKLLDINPSLHRNHLVKRLIKRPDLRVKSNARQDFDMIFLALSPYQAKQIVPLIHYYTHNYIPIYATSTLFSANKIERHNVDLATVRVCLPPWALNHLPQPLLRLKHAMLAIWPQSFEPLSLFYAQGVDINILLNYLPTIQRFAQPSIAGATGQLTINASQVINRKLQWLRIKS